MRLVLLTGSLVLAACWTDPEHDLVSQERSTVARWTLPDGGTASAGMGLRRRGLGLESTWEVSVPTPWLQYRAWLAASRAPGYREMPSDDAHLFFIRNLPGDVFSVAIAVVKPAAPATVLVTFSAVPD